MDNTLHSHCCEMEAHGLEVTDLCVANWLSIHDTECWLASAIGVSRLSCRACTLCITGFTAVNKVFRSTSLTKGCYLIWYYYPWHFPAFTRGDIEAARANAVFKELCRVFSGSYNGFRMRTRELSDSEAHSGSGAEIGDLEHWHKLLGYGPIERDEGFGPFWQFLRNSLPLAPPNAWPEHFLFTEKLATLWTSHC